MPGVVVLFEGSWMDWRRMAQIVLVATSATLDEPSPAGNFAYNTILVYFNKQLRIIAPKLGHPGNVVFYGFPEGIKKWPRRSTTRPSWQAAIERKVAQTYEQRAQASQHLASFITMWIALVAGACEIACKDKNGLPPGPCFRRVMYVEGEFTPGATRLNMSCNHCADARLPTCPTGAIWKRADNGVVDIHLLVVYWLSQVREKACL